MITLYPDTGSLYILLIWVTLVLVTMYHPVSHDYGSLYVLWLMITLYPLTMDHPLYKIVR